MTPCPACGRDHDMTDGGRIILFPRKTTEEFLMSWSYVDQPADVVPIRRGNDATPQLADGQKGA